MKTVNIEGYVMKLTEVGLSPSKKLWFICFNENPLKMIKNTFYFILKVLFALKNFLFMQKKRRLEK